MAATAWLPISRGDALPENALAVGTYGVDGMVYVPLSKSSQLRVQNPWDSGYGLLEDDFPGQSILSPSCRQGGGV